MRSAAMVNSGLLRSWVQRVYAGGGFEGMFKLFCFSSGYDVHSGWGHTGSVFAMVSVAWLHLTCG